MEVVDAPGASIPPPDRALSTHPVTRFVLRFMDTTAPHIPDQSGDSPEVSDALRIACLAAAIAASALVFSTRASTFLDVKETVLAVLLIPFLIFSVVRRDGTLYGVRIFLPLILLVFLPFAYSARPSFPHVPEMMHREQVRLMVLLLYAVFALDRLRDDRNRRRITNAFLGTAAAAALFAYVQRLGLAPWLFPVFEESRDPLYSVLGNSGLLGGYLAMAIPLVIHRALTGARPGAALVLLVAITPAIALSGSRAAWLAAAIGTLVSIPYRTLDRRRIFATTCVLIATAVATVAIVPELRPSHWFDASQQDTLRLRLWFWDGAIRMAADHPVIGVGPGQFQYWSPQYQGDALQGGVEHRSNELHTQYAHNEPLHFAAEYGILGVILCAWMLLRLLRCRGPEWGGLAAALTFGLVHFPLHSAPHALMAILFATMLLARGHIPKGTDNRTTHWPWFPLIGTFVSLLLAGFTIWDVLLPSIALRHANNLFIEGRPTGAAYTKAINTGRFHPQAHANYANALIQQGDLEQARTQIELALKGQDTGDLHLALGYIHLQQGNAERAKEEFDAAAHRWPNNQTIKEYLQLVQP